MIFGTFVSFDKSIVLEKKLQIFMNYIFLEFSSLESEQSTFFLSMDKYLLKY